MTKVKRIVRRETTSQGIFSRGKYRPVILIIEPPNLIGFRLKGERKTYYLTAEGCYSVAVKATLAFERREKAKARKERRKR